MLRPGNLYAATKACQNMIGSIYAKAYGMEIILVRAFNHVGPGQAPIFVVSAKILSRYPGATFYCYDIQ